MGEKVDIIIALSQLLTSIDEAIDEEIDNHLSTQFKQTLEQFEQFVIEEMKYHLIPPKKHKKKKKRDHQEKNDE
jgi:hypothetical protein